MFINTVYQTWYGCMRTQINNLRFLRKTAWPKFKINIEHLTCELVHLACFFRDPYSLDHSRLETTRNMKLVTTLVTLTAATKECNGPRYKPLGCFDDIYPHPEKMPQGKNNFHTKKTLSQKKSAIKLIHPIFKLTNLAYENIEIDWENPPIQRFNPTQDVVIMIRDTTW